MEENIKTVFHWTDLALDDYQKLINAEYPQGNSPNFVIARAGLIATESLAKFAHPYKNGAIPNRFDKIEAKPAIQYFYQQFFTNPRYAQIAYFLWDAYRNPLAHIGTLRKIVNVPIEEIKNSFLAGVHISGSTIEQLEVDQPQRKLEEKEHLGFYLNTNNRGIVRPIFRFSPVIYYFDLKEAVTNFKNKLSTDNTLRTRFSKAYPLFEESVRLDFQNADRIPPSETNLLIEEITDLL